MLAQGTPLNTINVLLVEDSRRDALLTKWQLNVLDDEFALERVGTLQEAIRKMRDSNVSVLLLDLGLPDSNGERSIYLLKEQFPDLPIVVLSGRTDEVAMLSALKSGAQEFLIKGECSGVMIRQAIRAAIFRKSLGTMALH